MYTVICGLQVFDVHTEIHIKNHFQLNLIKTVHIDPF